jgi:phospholipid-transporting ATPase
MEFFKCSIGGVMYGTGITEIQQASAHQLGVLLEEVNMLTSSNVISTFFSAKP